MAFIITAKTGEEFLVRRATLEDLEGLLAFITELVNEKAYILMDKPPSIEEERQWLERKVKEVKEGQVIHWVIEREGKIVGGVEARKEKWKKDHIVTLGIALLEEARGKGLGKAVMTRIIEEALKKWKDVKLIALEVFEKNERAKALYWKLGFRPVAKFPGWINHFGEYMAAETWYWKDSPLVKELGIRLEGD